MTVAPLEKSDMLQKTIDFPSQVIEAFTLSEDLTFPSGYNNISSILVLGMGGSGIVGDFLRVLLRNSSVPVCVNKHSVPPDFVNQNTLVLAITYSGRTQETLHALERCINSGAKIIGVTSAPELKSTCDEKKIPCIKIPENGQARASLGYLLIPVLCTLQNLGILRRLDYHILETIEVLKKIRNECSPYIPLKRNTARSLAFDLLDKLPIIYGEYNFTDVAAMRWKQQFNENAKIHCYYDLFPELVHNEIEAWEESKRFNEIIILLRDSIYEHDVGLQGKISATKEVVQQGGTRILEFWSKGRSELARLLSLTYLGDLTSIYLAIAKSVDPSSIHNIEFVKGYSFMKEMIPLGSREITK